MKNIVYIIFLAGLVMSCQNFLDVPPYDQVPEEDLFKNEKGVEKVLNGLYLGMVNRSLYGMELLCGVPEALAQNYYVTQDSHRYYTLARYEYEKDQSKRIVNPIWSAAYALIADANNFLENIEKQPDIFSPGKYDLFYGEGLAIRTYMHFDLLRLFGPVYDEENKSQPAIPYYDKVENLANPLSTAEEVMETLMRDIDKALVYLKNDPILTNGIGYEESFWDYRNFRLNYYAVLALKARMCLYAGGDYLEEAYHICSSLLENKDPITSQSINFSACIIPITRIKEDYIEPVFSTELLFGLHDLNREKLNKDYFSIDLSDEKILWTTIEFMTNLFNGNTLDRRRSSWSTAERGIGKVISKYSTVAQKENATYPYRYQTLPLIRLGELYLIAAETAPSDALKAYYLEQLRFLRRYQEGNTINQDLEELLNSEYRRELFAEGQYFYYLKRNKVESIVSQSGTRYQ
ncbi:MAG: RagB/SusD family nutrient uptake outer membrane protein, partial [Odoribacter sp.]|nr:RagB/SusD family nutrient uptake outer membrane protein [Odoribacter sp.]